MENENSQSKKTYVRIIGLAAAIAVIFLGVTQIRPTTFLGSLEHPDTELVSTLRIDPATVVKAKGSAISIDVVLHAGKKAPKDFTATLNYDPNLLSVSYIDTSRASFVGHEKHATYGAGTINISGTFLKGAAQEGQDVIVARIYFLAQQNIGDAELTFKTGVGNTGVTSYETSSDVLGDTQNGNVTLVIQ